ncbi:MAG: transglycosylase SLT domain-containing protein [Nitrospirota bacterium]|nr:transglycosylase SLT domain-containing protein [Nitrospirota bacterium]
MLFQWTYGFLLSAILLLTGCGAGYRIGAADPGDSTLAANGDPAALETGGPADPAAMQNGNNGADAPAIDAVTAADGVVESDDDGTAEEGPLDTALELVESARELWAGGDRDRAMEALDQAYSGLLNAPVDGNDKELQQQKDDLRFMISKRLTEIYSTRYTTANGTHKAIPIVVNEHVEREIRLFQTLERDFFLESYQRSGRYRDMILKMLREAGVPEDIAWLPLIESGFKVRALSRARALGLWQFIPSTGYKFGLKRTDWVDERLDPEKATAAAIAYLKELHQMFGDWATVLAAYNCGEGAVLRAIRTQKVNYLDNFWDLYERLPRETARYYPRFLATIAIIKEPEKYGFTLGELERPVPFEVVPISKPVNLQKLAEKIDCSVEDLSALNPELRYLATPGASYDLKVPVGKAALTIASVDALPKYSPPKPAYVVHRVRRGETLSTIAHRYRTSVQRIMDANNLRSGRMIRAGRKLKIPLTHAS